MFFYDIQYKSQNYTKVKKTVLFDNVVSLVGLSIDLNFPIFNFRIYYCNLQ